MILAFLIFIAFNVSADLRTDLAQAVRSTHHPISYKQANEILFTKLNKSQGLICGVYSPLFCLALDGIPSPKVMNIEHTWPQSEGARGDAKSDLHHLFAATSFSNSMRGSLPFCNVSVVKWEADQSKRGLNEFLEHCFEPPLQHKGNVARALFYFAVRYGAAIDEHQEMYLRSWHKEDLVDDEERFRNREIEKYQNNANPFIDNPELIDQISDF